MSDAAANLLVFIGVILIIVYQIIKTMNLSDDELKKQVNESKKRKSDEIKAGIRKSKIYGTRKERSARYWNYK